MLPDGVRQALWQADQLATPGQPEQPSGHAALDAELPGGGWPPGALTELLLAGPGQGELRLLAPLLARLSRAGKALVCINPPHRPHGPALQAWGIDLARLLWVATPQPQDAPWAAEQALAARAAVVLCWSSETDRPRQGLNAALRRLHLAAQGGDSLLFVLRPLAAAGQSSPAPLRLHCQPDAMSPAHLAVHLLKRRGPPQARPLRLDTRAWLAAPLLQRLDKVGSRPAALPVAPSTLPAIAHASPVVVPASA